MLNNINEFLQSYNSINMYGYAVIFSVLSLIFTTAVFIRRRRKKKSEGYAIGELNYDSIANKASQVPFCEQASPETKSIKTKISNKLKGLFVKLISFFKKPKTLSPMEEFQLLPPRETYLRRQLYRQFWHQRKLEKGFIGRKMFFRQLNANVRISNMEAAGQIPVRKSILLKKIIMKFPMRLNPEEIHKVLDESVLIVTIDGDLEYKYIIPEQIENNEAIFDVGTMVLGAGQSFSVSISFDNPNIAIDTDLTMVLETITDEPIT